MSQKQFVLLIRVLVAGFNGVMWSIRHVKVMDGDPTGHVQDELIGDWAEKEASDA